MRLQAAFLALLILGFGFGKELFGKSAFTQSEVAILAKELATADWPDEKLRNLFRHHTVKKLPNMISLNVTKPVVLKAQTYAHFAEPAAVERAWDFGRQWRKYLTMAQERTGVDLEVILAILLVETNLGRFTGKHQLLSIYPSIVVDATHLLTQDTVTKNAKLHKRVVRKRAWALEQIKAILQMKSKLNVDVYSLKGSYAGAIGLCQFLPTSYLDFARSFYDRTVDLFKAPDAIYSVANYLAKHGYRQGIQRQSNRKAVYAYNHSDVYVDIVLKAAQNIREFGTLKTTAH